MKIDSISLKGSNPLNEDRLVVNKKAAIYSVFDGCSSIVKWRSAEGETGGSLAAEIAAKVFEKAVQTDSLRELAGLANEQIDERMAAEQIERDFKEQHWGTVLAAVKVTKEQIEYVQIGDCMIFAVYRGGIIRPLTYPQVDHLEIRSLLKWKEGVDQGLATVRELSDYTRPTVLENRKKSNTWDGYGVLNGEPEAVGFLEYGTIHIGQLEHLVLVTDGLFWPEAEPNQEVDWTKTVKGIIENGLAAYTESIIKIEEEDPECQKFIRLKKSDDKTGLVLSF